MPDGFWGTHSLPAYWVQTTFAMVAAVIDIALLVDKIEQIWKYNSRVSDRLFVPS